MWRSLVEFGRSAWYVVGLVAAFLGDPIIVANTVGWYAGPKLPLTLEQGQMVVGALLLAAMFWWFHKQRLRFETPYPDMTIRDLFFHIDPHLLNDEKSGWSRVAREVQDALSVGRLQCWGRRIGQGAPQPRHRSTIQEMERSVWATGDFTMWFLDEKNEQLTHFVSKPAPFENHEWADLRISKEQALRVWPRPFWRRWAARDDG